MANLAGAMGMERMAPATCRDRTSEFLAIAERLSKQQGKTLGGSAGGMDIGGGGSALGGGVAGSGLGSGLGPSVSASDKSEFALRASRIGHGVHATSTKLARLAQLAKKNSLFDDPAREIAELTTIVKQDINALNSAISDLQQFSHRAQSNNNRQNVEHSSTVVNNLKQRLMQTTKEFKEVLTIRTENLKAHDNRRGLFSKEPRAGAGAHKPLFGGPPSAPLGSGGSAAGGMAAPASPGAGGGPAQMQAMQMVPVNVNTSRAEALQNVESTIAELGGIFQQLATMVAEQGEMAIRIDENVDETISNVDMAHTHLLKYLSRISSNRWLIMKIFAVLMFFLVVFVVFIA